MVADFIVGSPVRDDDFLFREEFVNDLWEALEKHTTSVGAAQDRQDQCNVPFA